MRSAFSSDGHRLRRTTQVGMALAIVLAPAAGYAVDGIEKAQQLFGLIEFQRDWVPPASLTLFDGQDPPASISIWDGLGPLFSESRCSACHIGPAIAGRFVSSSSGRVSAIGLVVRLGDAEGFPDPYYGEQIQTRAIENVQAEGRIAVAFPDGIDGDYELSLQLLRGDLHDGIAHAPLAAPALVGRGAIDRVDPAAVEALAVEQAARGDSIAGSVRRVFTADGEGIGLYGYKADHPSLFHQVAYSFSVEMGISSWAQPSDYGDCTPSQSDCLAAPVSENTRRGGIEISDQEIQTVVAYISGLDAPAQLDPDHPVNPDFMDVGCGSCHVPTLPAQGGGDVVLYSDLLLHDLGPDFDNGIGAPGVLPSQWRTAPLLALEPYPGRRYLHDGRASSLDAAIRAHGGEAEASRKAYESLDPQTRQRLIEFLETL